MLGAEGVRLASGAEYPAGIVPCHRLAPASSVRCLGRRGPLSVLIRGGSRMFRRAEAAIVRIEGVVLADSLAVASFVSPAGELRQFRFRAFGRHVRAACEASGCGDRGPGRSAALCPGSSSRRLSGKEARDVRESGGNRWSECLLKRGRGAEPWRSVGAVSGWRRGLDVYGRFCSGLSRLRLPVRSCLPESP